MERPAICGYLACASGKNGTRTELAAANDPAALKHVDVVGLPRRHRLSSTACIPASRVTKPASKGGDLDGRSNARVGGLDHDVHFNPSAGSRAVTPPPVRVLRDAHVDGAT